MDTFNEKPTTCRYYQGDTIVFDIKSTSLTNCDIHITIFDSLKSSVISMKKEDARQIDEFYRFTISSKISAAMPTGCYYMEIMKISDKVRIEKSEVFAIEESQSKNLIV